MKPIPAPSSRDQSGSDSTPAAASNLLKSEPGKYSNSNRRSAQAEAQQIYPWLLILSTAIAVFFGLMYIYKPVMVASDGLEKPVTEDNSSAANPNGTKTGLLPSRNQLPGDEQAMPTTGNDTAAVPASIAPLHSRYEETNLRVQHILQATTDDGHVSRIDIEVPVLYPSRSLRWSPSEVTRARELMVQLMDYQDKSRQLRAQGESLLSEWNSLINNSIPESALRADSPSLPENQDGALSSLGPIDTTTRDAVEIQTKDTP